ncbi:hypothetical protein SpCBS45565_g06425 [Spizellomyces sp. 'palustris']|nr:hypothetical protein SpCBS45565_g06425 [Spizellomyces sp. 'palustris']
MPASSSLPIHPSDDMDDSLVSHIKLRTYSYVGQAYFQELAETLCECLGVLVAFVGQLAEEDDETMSVLDSTRDDYKVGKRPCNNRDVGFSLIASYSQERVRNTSATVFPIPKDIFAHLDQGDPIVIPSQLASIIPTSTLKAFPDANLESCCLLALKNASGVTIGILGVGTNVQNSLHLHAMAPESASTPLAARVLKEVGCRVSKELERSTELRHLKIESAAAQAATKSKTHFLANMSHEIRTPVSAIIGLTDMILWDSTDLKDEQRNRLELINSSGEHLLAVINDILDLSKIGDEDLKFVLQDRPMSLRRCLKEAVQLASMSPSLSKKRIIVVEGHAGNSTPTIFKSVESVEGAAPALLLRWDVDPSVPDMIIGDTTRLRQIVMNLLSNALKFTNRGAVTLNVTKLPSSPLANTFTADNPLFGPSGSEGCEEQAVTLSGSPTFEGRHIPTPPQTLDRRSSIAGMRSNYAATAGTMSTVIESKQDPGQEQDMKAADERVSLLFTVVDTGIGIPRSKINRLFIPFSQIDNEVTRGSGVGTGLGLAISSRLVQMMGGHIWVESSEGVGSKFAFCIGVKPAPPGATGTPGLHHGISELGSTESLAAALPLLPEARATELEDPTVVGDQAMTRTRRNARINRDLAKMYPIKILVAEDNAINQQIALSVLKKMGYEADIAWNGREVLQKIFDEGKHYDLILMDICMPYLDGLATTRELLARCKTPPLPSTEISTNTSSRTVSRAPPSMVIIALTASATTDDRAKCEQAGMHDWLAKPFKALELQEKIAKHFGHLVVNTVAAAAEPLTPGSAAEPTNQSSALASTTIFPIDQVVAAVTNDIREEQRLLRNGETEGDSNTEVKA